MGRGGGAHASLDAAAGVTWMGLLVVGTMDTAARNGREEEKGNGTCAWCLLGGRARAALATKWRRPLRGRGTRWVGQLASVWVLRLRDRKRGIPKTTFNIICCAATAGGLRRLREMPRGRRGGGAEWRKG